MYLLSSWSSSARNDKVLKDKANFMPTQQQRSSMTQIPLLNKMKRKRSDVSPASPLLERAAAKRKTDTMSHVGIPTTDIPKVILHRHEDQLDRKIELDQTIHGQGLIEMQWERADASHPQDPRLKSRPKPRSISTIGTDFGFQQHSTLLQLFARSSNHNLVLRLFLNTGNCA